MTVEILIFCHFFGRRLCWVLSSLCQQEPHELDIIVNISGIVKDNGTPSINDVTNFFLGTGLTVKTCLYATREEIAFPSLLKNDQIRNSNADWIMCHSADHVFSPKYFQSVEKAINDFPDEMRVMGSGNKTHTDATATDTVLETLFDRTPIYCPDTFGFSSRIKDIDYRVRRGAGGHFIFRRQACLDQTGGFYATAEQCKDKHLFNQYMNTRSDPGFRNRMNGINKIRLEPLRHLNHIRSKTVGHYVERQN